MWNKKKTRRMSLQAARGKGMTLIELVISIAVLALVSTILITSYTDVMVDQRMEADMATLNNIDTSLAQILLYDDAFEEVEPHVDTNTNKIQFAFKVNYDSKIQRGYVSLSETMINGAILSLPDTCPKLYAYLKEYVGETITLTSPHYQQGTYRVDVTFNGTRVTDQTDADGNYIRDYTINNDNIIITNNGDSELNQLD